MRIPLIFSALLLSAFSVQFKSSFDTSETRISYALLSAQTEQKDDIAPHRGSGRRRSHQTISAEDLGEF